MILKIMITLGRLQLVKDMITQLAVLLDYPYFKEYCNRLK